MSILGIILVLVGAATSCVPIILSCINIIKFNNVLFAVLVITGVVILGLGAMLFKTSEDSKARNRSKKK